MTLGPEDCAAVLKRLADTLDSRHPERGGDPEKSYTSRLMHKGLDAILKKIGEESTEVIMAAKDGEKDAVVYEVADLWYHCMVALAYMGLRPEDILTELARREGMSGLAEKASRSPSP